jgi:uncharacterized protein YdhG (YjbR/CyaY superfamily)
MEKKTAANIDEFIAGFPAEVQDILRKFRQLIGDLAPGAVEAMAYGMPTFRLKGKNLVHFSTFTNHIGFYPTPSGVVTFEKELVGYKTSKGAIQFPMNRPIPYDLVEKIVKFRVAEVNSQAK